MKDQRYEKERRERALQYTEDCHLRILQLATSGALFGKFSCQPDILNDVEIALRIRFPDSKFSIEDSHIIIVDWS
jgi:hypothetical protein